MDIKQSLSVTAPIRIPVVNWLRDPQRSLQAPSVPQRSLQPLVVTQGFRTLPSLPPAPFQQRTSQYESMPMTGPIRQTGQYSDQGLIPANHGPSSSLYNQLSSDRAWTTVAKPTAVKQRKPRTCVKCAYANCNGKKEAALCLNVCRDCKKVTCRGRNSKYPTRTCDKAWE